MRIISGKFKGKSIEYVKSSFTRPLKDSVKENIFNILNHSKEIKVKIERSYILDLYSGTGSFGLECLSRGAKEVTFVENNSNAINLLKKNILDLSIFHNTEIIKDRVENIKNLKITKKYQILFADPPYSDDNFFKNLVSIKNNQILDGNHVAIIHRERKRIDNFDNLFTVFKEKIYGRSKILFGIFN